jgi:predicted acylesterase/phospholipase RssA
MRSGYVTVRVRDIKMHDTKTNTGEVQRDLSTEYHVVFGAGGSKAILGATGAIVAFEKCGFTKFATIGGVSGGSIPASLFANGTSAQELLQLAIGADFTKFLIPKSGWLSRIWALLSKYRYERTLPLKGVYSGKPIQELIDGEVKSWPAGFWTMAASLTGHSVLFTSLGAYWNWQHAEKPEGFEGPVSVGTAVNASCAIPGIIDAVEYSGWHLFDGAIGDAGSCPTLPVQVRLGARPEKIIAFDLPDDHVKKSWWLRTLWHLRCGGSCGNIDGMHPTEDEGNIVISPTINGFHGLTFDLTRVAKWHAITASYVATVRRLEKAGLIPGDRKAAAIALCEQLEQVSFDMPLGQYAVVQVERIFAEHGFSA